MNLSSNNTKLNYNTHNTTAYIPNVTVCWNKRPCYRNKCDYCWGRRLAYMAEQIGNFAKENKLEQMVTVLIQHEFEHPQESLKRLAKMRPKVLRALRKHTKTISVIAVAPWNGPTLAHFHIITQAIDETFIVKILKKVMAPNINVKVSKRYGDLHIRMKGLLAYFIKKNLRPSLMFKPRGLRLMTSSRGFFTGRPRYNQKFAWL